METIAGVVEANACSGCGMCVAICPVGAVSLHDHCRPVVSGACTACGMCAAVYPRVSLPCQAIEAETARDNGADRHDDLLGFYTRTGLARVFDEAVRSRSYWGGTTTAFVSRLLEQDRIDTALLTGPVHDCSYCSHPRPRTARTIAEVHACAFTRPVVNPLLARSGESPVRERCRELTGNITWLIGLNCFFANTFHGVDRQLKKLGLQEHDIRRFFYARGIPSVELPDGTVREISGGNTDFSVLHPGCLLCYPSYTARLSDVTFGKTMSPVWGWNDVICRSRKAGAVLREMEARSLIEIRPAPRGGEELLESLLEAAVFSLDAIGYAAFLESGTFQPDETATSMLTRPGGTISGITRLRLIQAVRRHSFYEPAVAARRAKGLFVPQLT